VSETHKGIDVSKIKRQPIGGQHTVATNIIGLSGKARSGKDTFAEALVQGAGYTRVAFADPLRELALKLDPVIDVVDRDTSCGDPDCCGGPWPDLAPVRLADLHDAVGWEGIKSHPTETIDGELRRTLIRLGDGVREVLGRTTWLDAAMRRAAEIEGPVVITDVRYRNEAEAVIAAGGIVVRIERPEGGDALLPEAAAHASETELDDFGGFAHLVLNVGTIDDLQAAALEVARINA